MNCAVGDKIHEGFRWYEDREPGQARFLFLNIQHLGWRTQADLTIQWTAQHPALAAVHLNLARPLWLRILGRQAGIRGWDAHLWRYMKLSDVWLRTLMARVPLHEVDLMHVMPHSFGSVVSRLKRSHPGIKTAIQLDQTGILEMREFGRSLLAHHPAIACERQVFAHADRIGAWSEWAAESVVQDYHQPPGKVVLIRPSVELPPLVARHEPKPVKACRVVFVGNDWVRKQGPRLLELHQRFWSEKMELHIISARAPIDPRARNVVWHGSQPRHRVLNELMPSMDLLVLMTSEDTFGLVLEEAAAVGLPVVTTRMAGLSEIVLDGDTGFLVPPNDWVGFREAVEKLVADPGLRARMGKAAREHVKRHFDPSRNYNHYLAALLEVCGDARPKPAETRQEATP
jgi:glycosyltransferase involved in cell wall biosynthesis